MDDDSTHIHQLNTTTRAVCSHNTSDPSIETSRFYAGTCSTHEQNKIYVIDFDDYENNINVEYYKTVVTTPIWQIQHNHNHLLTISDKKAQIYDTSGLASLDKDHNDQKLKEQEKVPNLTLSHQIELEDNQQCLYGVFNDSVSLSGTVGDAVSSSESTEIAILSNKLINLYDLNTFQSKSVLELNKPIQTTLERGEIKFNPHWRWGLQKSESSNHKRYSIIQLSLTDSVPFSILTRKMLLKEIKFNCEIIFFVQQLVE